MWQSREQHLNSDLKYYCMKKAIKKRLYKKCGLQRSTVRGEQPNYVSVRRSRKKHRYYMQYKEDILQGNHQKQISF